jgi:glycosyltransferase involved in cell wall biosynthesis
VLLEAWLAGTPVLVNGHCAVTREHCLASNGGLFFSTLTEFVGGLEYLLADREMALRMARNGRRYVLANYTWDRVVPRYVRALHRWGFDL